MGYIFNPGPEHHVYLHHYAAAFPEARVMVAAGRIERENPALCSLVNVESMALGDAVPELSRQGFHVHVWDGFMEGKVSNLSQLRFNAPRGTAEPTMFWHEESNTIVNGGHGWWYWGEKPPLPWPARKLLRMVRGQLVWSPAHYTVHDDGRCAESAQRILDWRFDTLLDINSREDVRMTSGVHEAVERLCRPLIERRWDDLPFGRETLQIPEGKVTGGDWKSYRS